MAQQPNSADSQTTETITSVRLGLDFNEPDDELILAIDNAIKDSSQLKLKNDSQGKINKLYWQYGGKVEDDAIMHPKQSKTRMNRIFTDVETLIPILTSEEPEPIATGTEDNQIKTVTQKAGTNAWDKYKMQTKFQCLARHWILFRIGVLKYRWQKGKGFVTENVFPKKIGFDKRATNTDNCEYIWEELEDSVGEVIKKFPNAKKDLENQFSNKGMKTKIKYHEFWGGGGAWVVWKYDKLILDKEKNMNFDYDIQENNIFETPEFPYIFLNVFSLGDENSLYDDTTPLEVAEATQDGINDLERLILDLNKGRKRVIMVDGAAVSEKQAQSLVNDIGDDLIRIENAHGNLASAAQLLQAGVPDAGMFNNLLNLLNEVDNIFGIHSTTKGSQEHKETARGRQLLMAGDYGRIDMIVRNMEECAEKWFNAYLHMTKVYADQPEKFDDGENRFSFDPSIVPYGVRMIVKKGSTLPTDEISKRDAATELSQMGMIDPESMFDELGYPNPQEMAQKLYQWLLAQGKLQSIPGQAQPQLLPQQGQEGQPNVPQGGAQGGSMEEQAQRVDQMVQSPEFQALPDQEKLAFIQKAKVALQGGSQPQQGIPQ